MKLENEFNTYLADMAIMTMKLHNLHWNVEGSNFTAVHLFTEGEYNKFFERMDEIAEAFKMFNTTPKSTMKEFMEIATIKEEATRAFSCEEALEIYLADIASLKKQAVELRNLANEEDWFTTVAILEDHIADYNKQAWFVKATLG